ADEPTGALDTHAGDEVLGVLRERCDAGAAAVVVTHNPRHAAWADRVVFLRDGREVTRSEYAARPARAAGGDWGGAREAAAAAWLGAPALGLGRPGSTGAEPAEPGAAALPLTGLGTVDHRR
ncbi:MAG TPA: hypothetical protein VF143_08100, partial [Candidatus Nanopelagicales bacterium]